MKKTTKMTRDSVSQVGLVDLKVEQLRSLNDTWACALILFLYYCTFRIISLILDV